MASAPEFFTTPTLQASVISATAYAGTRTAPTGTTTIYTASTSLHTQVRQIAVKTLLTSVAGLLDFWIYNGTTYYHLSYTQTVQALTGSTTADPYLAAVVFGEGNKGLVLPALAGTAWTIVAGFSVTQTTAAACVVQGATA